MTAIMAESQRTDYEQIQQDEIAVLQSIFMEDFVEEKSKAAAWNVGCVIASVVRGGHIV